MVITMKVESNGQHMTNSIRAEACEEEATLVTSASDGLDMVWLPGEANIGSWFPILTDGDIFKRQNIVGDLGY